MVIINVQRRAIHPHLQLPSVLILPRSLLTVHAENTLFLTQPADPILATTRSSFAQPALIRFQRVCLCVRDHSKDVRISAKHHAILVHVLHVGSHLSGHVAVGQQRVPSPAVPRRPRRNHPLSFAINLVARCAHVDTINVLDSAVR